MTHIFIAYANEDQVFAASLARLLSQMGADVWIETEAIPPGMKRHNAIQQGLEMCEVMLLIVTPESMQSANVKAEWFYFLQNDKPVIPILYRQAPLHSSLNALKSIDFEKSDYERAFRRLHSELLQRGVTLHPLPKRNRYPVPHFIQGNWWAILVGVLVILVGVALAVIIRSHLLTPTGTHTSAPLTPINTLSPDQIAQVVVTQNAEWIPVERDFDGVTMVLVPAGCFMMGNSDTDDEQPVHKQCLEQPFWIDKFEVTNAQYGSVGCESYSSEPNQPRNCVTWFEARDFCAARGERLPTEVEWEYAARGPDGLIYPWGNNFVAENVIYSDSPGYGYTKTSVVGSRPDGASWVGALDMSGNVWEWGSSVYGAYPYSGDPCGARGVDLCILRGGSFNNAINSLRTTSRFANYAAADYYSQGFRCVRDVE